MTPNRDYKIGVALCWLAIVLAVLYIAAQLVRVVL